jgi:hypothetical protein
MLIRCQVSGVRCQVLGDSHMNYGREASNGQKL